MADKRINELEEALSIAANDWFVMEQANTAKKLSGQTMTDFLLALANGHGGIASIDKTSSSATDPVVDTYTITFADQTTTTFEVTNGAKGNTGARGPQGPKGDDATITSTSVMYQAWPSGTQYPTGTWVDNPPAVTPGNYLWTRTIVNYSDGNQTVSYSVARWGIDGSGAVVSVNGNLPDQNGNVALTASDVGALPNSYQAPVTSVNGATGAVDLGAADVGAVPGLSVSATRSAAGWYRVLTHAGAFPDGSIIKFKIGRNQNGECHEIDLLVPHDEAFMNETSKTGTDFGVTKIRVTADANNRHVDVYMALSVSSLLSVAFEPSGTITQTNVTAGTLQAVADAPTGETVRTEYAFARNTHISGSVAGSYGTIYYDRKGGVCSIYGDVNNLPNGAWTTLATGLPKPARTQFFIAQNGASADFVMCLLTASGTLQFYGRGSYSSGYPTWTYICN